MARPQSVALGGYFPTPSPLLPALASLVELEEQATSHVLVDPCAGDGAAILGLRSLWRPEGANRVKVLAVELERERAEVLRAQLGSGGCPLDRPLHADAFHVEITPENGASVLFLNPPYDVDRIEGRLEQRFLERWTPALLPGDGVLLLVVPFYALKASASYLACQYQNLRAWRFPDPWLQSFRQCVVAGRRRAVPVPDNPLDERRIERWAGDLSSLPELSEVSQAVFTVAAPEAGLRLKPLALDLPGLVEGFQPWHRAAFAGLNRPVENLIGARLPVAQPPRPAHIALALAVGALNGKRLVPNEPGLPPILVKGSFRRDFQVVEQCFNSKGERVGTLQVQKPRLTLHALRLDNLEFLEFRPGAVGSGARRLEEMNSADFVETYSRSLSHWMREQFPALHDPAAPGHEMALPPMSRKPYKVQREAIVTALKLLAQGQNPQIIAEVGTGKSTVSLSVAGALGPGHFAATRSELEQLGFDTSRLSPVRRTLILCPPHLLQSWHDQAAAVLPHHRVVTVSSLSDLDAEAEIFVLSREVAKLGHGYLGIGSEPVSLWRGVCPRCGRRPRVSAERLAQSRGRCKEVHRQAVDPAARLAEELGAALVRTYPFDPLVRAQVARYRVLARSLPPLPELPEDGGEPLEVGPQPSGQRLQPVVERLVRLVLEGPGKPELHEALREMARATGREAQVGGELREASGRLLEVAQEALGRGVSTYENEVYLPRHQAERLLAQADRLEEPESGATRRPRLLRVLDLLCQVGRWEAEKPCGEPLYQAIPDPRRFPLARYILRHCRRRFDLVIADEWHEYSNRGSAQQRAAHRLVELPGVPTLALTGSLMGGYASSLFPNMWSLSQRFRRQFHYDEHQAFISAYGYRKIFVPDEASNAPESLTYGSRSDRVESRGPGIESRGQAPGILPSFLFDHLLPVALLMHKGDLEDELPPCTELPVPITVAEDDGTGQELLAEYRRLLSALGSQIQKDRFSSLAGKLWGAMAEMPSFLDRATGDLGEFELRYPEEVGGERIATAKPFPAFWITPKERWLLRRARASIEQGRNVLLFLRHTGSFLPNRLIRLFKEYLGQRAVFLDARKVKAAGREAWLNEHIVRPGCRILLTNPKAVQTGLNNLVHFSHAIWFEGLDFDARVVRQANGRLDRIGQTREVTIDVPYYDGTLQKTAVDLVARKITSSEQVDGLSIEGALESAGAGQAGSEDSLAAYGMGRAIFDAWLQG